MNGKIQSKSVNPTAPLYGPGIVMVPNPPWYADNGGKTPLA